MEGAFCLLLGPPGFSCWFPFTPVFQWCCSTPQGSPGGGRNTLFLSSPHLCFIIVFICFPWWFIDELEKLHADRTTIRFEPWQKLRVRLGSRKTCLSTPPPPSPPPVFYTDRSKAVHSLWFPIVTCSWCSYLCFGSLITLVTYFSKFYVAEWPPVWERAVHSVYRTCLS